MRRIDTPFFVPAPAQRKGGCQRGAPGNLSAWRFRRAAQHFPAASEPYSKPYSEPVADVCQKPAMEAWALFKSSPVQRELGLMLPWLSMAPGTQFFTNAWRCVFVTLLAAL